MSLRDKSISGASPLAAGEIENQNVVTRIHQTLCRAISGLAAGESAATAYNLSGPKLTLAFTMLQILECMAITPLL